MDSDSRSNFIYYQYLLHLFREEFLDTVIADGNLYAEKKITLKVHWKFIQIS